MVTRNLIHEEDFLYVWNQILKPKHFYNYYDEFKGENNNWMFDKLVTPDRQAPKREVLELPWFGGISKPYSDQSIGINFGLIDLSTRLKIIAEQTVKTKLQLKRINTNIQFFGQDTLLHTDDTEDTSWTFLVFFNHSWFAEHGGEFILIKPDGSSFTCLPLPNRGVLFRASLHHAGKGPNRFCGTPRLSVACTYVKA